jgi:aerotaxis receptor
VRQNLPVTQKEYVIKDGVTLMSITDLESHIQYCNAAFIDVSGFSHDELMSQPHNLVRHPDMPPAAFADMWKTLKGGDSWTGLVKNRRKNGDHYWVRANATPVQRDGDVVGYASVRTKPSADEIASTTALYRDLMQGRTKGRGLHKGLVVRTGLLAWMSMTQLMPISWRMALGLLTQLAGTSLAAWALGVNSNTLVNLVLLQTAVSLFVGFCLNRQIAAPLKQILKQANQVAAGQAPDGKPMNRVDEIGMIMRAVNQAGLNLQSLVDDVSEQVAGVANSSRELSHGNADLSQRTEHTSSSLQRTAAAVLETAQSLEQNAGSAQQVSTLSNEASDMAREGCDVVIEVILIMTSIQEASEKIADIIGIIDDIAFQTNILALNAAVEAARAGEQGRSFAVVAGEVRTLAERSTEAAREIKSLINDSAERIEKGSDLASNAGVSMEDIRERFNKVSELIEGISAAVIEQSSAVGQVSDAINELDDMTSRNTELVAESSASSNSLLARASRLSEAVEAYGTAPEASTETTFDVAGEAGFNAAHTG